MSLPLSFAGRSFGLTGTARGSPPGTRPLPAVDIFLPVCGEPIEMLRNTWTASSSWPAPTRARLRLRPGRRPEREAHERAAASGSAT